MCPSSDFKSIFTVFPLSRFAQPPLITRLSTAFPPHFHRAILRAVRAPAGTRKGKLCQNLTSGATASKPVSAAVFALLVHVFTSSIRAVCHLEHPRIQIHTFYKAIKEGFATAPFVTASGRGAAPRSCQTSKVVKNGSAQTLARSHFRQPYFAGINGNWRFPNFSGMRIAMPLQIKGEVEISISP